MSKHDIVDGRIRGWIRSGQLKAGDRLPSIARLLDEFDVAMTVSTAGSSGSTDRLKKPVSFPCLVGVAISDDGWPLEVVDVDVGLFEYFFEGIRAVVSHVLHLGLGDGESHNPGDGLGLHRL